MNCTIGLPSQLDILQFSYQMRFADRREVKTWYQQSVIEVLLLYLKLGVFLRMLYQDNHPVALFGCGFKQIENMQWMGVPFFLATEQIQCLVKPLVFYSHLYVNAFLRCCSYLFNYVDSRNHLHVRYLEHFRFTIAKENGIMVNDVYFYPFYRMSKEHSQCEHPSIQLTQCMDR